MIPWRKRLDPYPKQRRAIFDPPRHAIIEASPKSGKTVGCLQWLIEETEKVAAHIDHPRFLWVAPVLGQAEIAFMRCYQEVLKIEDVELHKTNRTVTLPSGAVLVFRSAERPDLIYGEDYWAVVIDEASDMKEDAWRAVTTTRNHTKGRIRIITNVRNRRNWAYRHARKVEKGLDGWEHHLLNQDDAIEAGIVESDTDDEQQAWHDPDWYRMTFYNEVGDDLGVSMEIDRLDRRPVPEQVYWARGWDLAATLGGGWTAGVKLAANHEGFWIVDVVRERAEAQGVFDIMRLTAALDGPEVDHVVEEEKGSSGKLLLESTRERFYQIPTAGPVWPAGVEQNKIIRALPLAAAIREGRVHLAPELNATELLAEMEMWPHSRYDDQTDAMAHAFNHLAPLATGPVGTSFVPGRDMVR